MLTAAIDVGSNTIRMLIGDVQDNGVSRIYSNRVITRLAAGIGDSGNLGEENMKKSLSVLKGFSSSIASYGVTHVSAVGTSALREAKNSREFLDTVFQETGIRIEIISGMKEAELTAKGILGSRETSEPSLIIDIGGGSTEWIIHKAGPHELLYGSFPIGVVNLFERCIKTDPPSLNDISALNNEIDSQLLQLKVRIAEHFQPDELRRIKLRHIKSVIPACPEFFRSKDGRSDSSRSRSDPARRSASGLAPRFPTSGNDKSEENKLLNPEAELRGILIKNLTGTGGTITTLTSIDLGLKEYDYEKIHMHKISIDRLYQIKDMLLSLPLSKRQDINGLEPERADLIIPGILLTIRVMELFGFNEITVSDHGLLEGLLKSTSRRGERK